MRKFKWSLEEQATLLKKIGELLERGYPLAEAIHSLIYHMKSNRKDEILQCLSHLREGHPFYKFLITLNFNKTLIGFVYFAELHGGLAHAFLEGSEMMLKRNQDLERLKKVLAYPIMLLVITFILFLFINHILLPRFSSLFHSMNLSPNVFTKFIYLTGNFIPLYFLVSFILFLLLISYYLLSFRKLSPIKQRTIISKIPIIGGFSRLLYSHYFSVQLSYLLGGGLSILEALKLFESHIKQPLDEEIGREMKQSLITGKKLEDIVKEYPFFVRELHLIVKHGQDNGKLDQELFFFSKHCLITFQLKTDRLLKIVQPLLFSMIGIIIVSMYLAILLPMFHLLKGI